MRSGLEQPGGLRSSPSPCRRRRRWNLPQAESLFGMLDLCHKSRTDQVGGGVPAQAPLAQQATTRLTILQAILPLPVQGFGLACSNRGRGRFMVHSRQGCTVAGCLDVGQKYGHMSVRYSLGA